MKTQQKLQPTEVLQSLKSLYSDIHHNPTRAGRREIEKVHDLPAYSLNVLVDNAIVVAQRANIHGRSYLYEWKGMYPNIDMSVKLCDELYRRYRKDYEKKIESKLPKCDNEKTEKQPMKTNTSNVNGAALPKMNGIIGSFEDDDYIYISIHKRARRFAPDMLGNVDAIKAIIGFHGF